MPVVVTPLSVVELLVVNETSGVTEPTAPTKSEALCPEAPTVSE